MYKSGDHGNNAVSKSWHKRISRPAIARFVGGGGAASRKVSQVTTKDQKSLPDSGDNRIFPKRGCKTAASNEALAGKKQGEFFTQLGPQRGSVLRRGPASEVGPYQRSCRSV